MALSPHPLEREHDKFDLDANDKTAVRTTNASLDSTARTRTFDLAMSAQLATICDTLQEINFKLGVLIDG